LGIHVYESPRTAPQYILQSFAVGSQRKPVKNTITSPKRGDMRQKREMAKICVTC
jgi:hypothetical protein